MKVSYRNMRKEPPPFAALRVFAAVAKEKSITAAAKELEVSPAAVSQQMTKLEKQLGVSLLKRESRRVGLTSEGEAFAAKLVQAFDQIDDAIDSVQQRESRSVTFVSSPSFNSKCIPPIIKELTISEPQIDLNVISERDYEKALESDFDIACLFVPSIPDHYEFEHFELAKESMVILASPSLIERFDIRTPEDLLNVPVLADNSMSGFGIETPSWDDALLKLNLNNQDSSQLKLSFDSNAGDTIDAAISGNGVLLGRRVLSTSAINEGRLVNLFDLDLPMDCSYHIIAKPEKLNSPQVAAAWKVFSTCEEFGQPGVRSDPEDIDPNP